MRSVREWTSTADRIQATLWPALLSPMNCYNIWGVYITRTRCYNNYGSSSLDDMQFEKQSALFALMVSDVILVNMPLHDIGREQGGSFPLLTFFLQQRGKLDPCKTRVVFVIRDYGYEIPPNMLENKVKENLEKRWREDVQPRKNAEFSDYFPDSVELLPSKSEAFKQKCTQLKKRFSTNNRAGSRQDKVPASGFSSSGKLLWDNIRQNRNLNLSDQKFSEPKCVEELKKISATAFDEPRIEVALKNEMNPIASSNIVVDSCLKKLVKLCKAKGLPYKSLVTKQHEKAKEDARKKEIECEKAKEDARKKHEKHKEDARKKEIEKAKEDACKKHEKPKEDARKKEIEREKAKEDARKKHEKAIEDTRKKHEKAIEVARKKHEKVIDDARKKHEKAIEDAHKKHEKAIEDAHKKHEKPKDDARKKKIEREKAKEDARKKHEKAIEDTRKKHEKVIDDARKKHEEAIEDARKKHDKAIEDARKKHEKVKEDARKKREKAEEDVRKKSKRRK